MIFKTFKGGYDRNFTYILGDDETKEAIVIDAQSDVSEVLTFLESTGLKLVYIFSTHGHPDHISGNKELKEKTGASVVMHSSARFPSDVKVEEGDKLEVGSIEFEFIFTPGHCPDHMCILVNSKMLFTGDVLFVGKIGGTGPYFPGSDPKAQYDSLNKIILLDGDIVIYPGHDFGSTPTSTVKRERESNPFLIQKSFEDFMYVKNNWKEYKKKHGL